MKKLLALIVMGMLAASVMLLAVSAYPSSTKSFSTRIDGQTIAASWFNEIQDEIVAIENGLRLGVDHDLLPLTDGTRDLGTTSKNWRDGWFSRDVGIEGTLNADGNTTLGGTLAVTGTTTLTGAVTLSAGDSTVKIGASTETAKLGGIINTDSVSAATIANTSATTLFSYTLPANAMDVDGRVLRFTAWGGFAANGNTKTVTLKWNGASGTSIMSYSAAPNNQNWVLQGTVIRTGSSTQDFFGISILGPTAATNATYGTATATDTAAITLHVTAQNGTAAANDIVYEGSILEFLN